ncbi:MAG: beta-lactamase family protein, partial [Microbacterium sp.]|nr:beta-lactamase family protein [Microbacterium sp.]
MPDSTDPLDRTSAPPFARAIDTAIANGAQMVVGGVTTADGATEVHAAGLRTPDPAEPATADTVIALYSATKAFTATAALQCVEDGVLDLDAPAREYVPEIGDLPVLEALGDDGSIRTRPARHDITARMLLLHTSGLAYDMFDTRYALIARERMKHPSATPLRDPLRTPLLHEPGERWTYGTSSSFTRNEYAHPFRAPGKKSASRVRAGMAAGSGVTARPGTGCTAHSIVSGRSTRPPGAEPSPSQTRNSAR